ncbi:MAG: DUF4147 domain-containing protein, partial [Phycisphaerales bacterium]|nr:DUF4147 domain-containing protein [Phycisphaerales bacterium]
MIDAIRRGTDPARCVSRHLERPDRPVRVVAFGKASARMMDAALQAFESWDVEVRDALCVTVPGVEAPSGGRTLVAD